MNNEEKDPFRGYVEIISINNNLYEVLAHTGGDDWQVMYEGILTYQDALSIASRLYDQMKKEEEETNDQRLVPDYSPTLTF